MVPTQLYIHREHKDFMPYTGYLKMGHRPEVKVNAVHSIQKQSWEEWGLDKRVMERGSSLQLSYI